MRHQKQEEGESPFGIEDLLYYVKKVEDQEFNLDFVTVKQYFPVSLVLSGIFKIMQDLFGNHFHWKFFEGMILPPLLMNLVFFLFSSCLKKLVLQLQFCIWFFALPGLRFEEVIDAEIWHCDVKLYSVFDLNSGELIGYFFLDLYTRFDQDFKLL